MDKVSNQHTELRELACSSI